VSTPESEVGDAFISYLHGIIVGDFELNATGEELQASFPEFIPSEPTPFLDIVNLYRGPSASVSQARLTVRFSVPLDYEVPVDILGHHPVVLLGSTVIGFEEVARSREDLPADISVPERTDEVVVLRRSIGFLGVDFAGWLDWISGRLLEDVDVTMLALVRYDGVWNALMGGYSPEGRAMTGIVNLQKSAFRVRPPKALSRLARDLVEAEW